MQLDGHFLAGTVLVAAPHMDDEALACGGTIALAPNKASWHIVYATDGTGSPEPVIPWRDRTGPDLGQIRRREAIDAMASLGVPDENLYFLDLPDGRLRHHTGELHASLTALVTRLQPDFVLSPFRYDRHPDHLAVNRVLTAMARANRFPGRLIEYFVYHHWRLLPGGDVREYIRPGLRESVDIAAAAAQKRFALGCYRSQTTCFYPWQMRPNLTPALLDAVCRDREQFLPFDSTRPGAAIFVGRVAWIRLAHRLEPVLKKRKDRLVSWWLRGVRR